MLTPKSITWVIVANARRCRALEERRRGAELRELAFWDRRPTEADRHHAHHEKAVSGQRFGFGQSVVNLRDFEEQAEWRFLARYAHQLKLAGAKGRYEHLILIAPPPALGMLREALGRTAQRYVERTETCDCVEETPEALRLRIRELRAPR